MTHLKRSLGIGLWFMFLTLPLMVVRQPSMNCLRAGPLSPAGIADSGGNMTMNWKSCIP